MQFNGAAFNGAEINGSAGYVLIAGSATYAINGGNASGYIGYLLIADAGSIQIQGKDAGLIVSYILNSETCQIGATFSDANFYTGYQLQADTAAYLVASPDQGLLVDVLQLAIGRGVHVAAENRITRIEKDDRLVSAGGPDSAIIVEMERRTINVMKEQL